MELFAVAFQISTFHFFADVFVPDGSGDAID